MRGKIKTFVNKCLSVSYMGEGWNNKLIQDLIEAGRTIGYIETISNKADKLHLSIKNSDEKRFIHEFEQVTRFAIARLGLKGKKVRIAFDVTEDKTWCKNNYNLRASSKEHHINSWQYLNVAIVCPYFIPLMSIPYTQIRNLDDLVINLLEYTRRLPFVVDLYLFDRGFYHGHLIDFLENRKGRKPFPYLMLVPKKGKIKEFAEQTINLRYFEHEIKYKKDQTSWKTKTKIICRRIDEDVCWCYATNQKPSLLLLSRYSQRWNIETGFRIHDEARIKSKSKHMMIRYFYHLIGMLLVILWRIENLDKSYTFKGYLKETEDYFKLVEIKELWMPP